MRTTDLGNRALADLLHSGHNDRTGNDLILLYGDQEYPAGQRVCGEGILPVDETNGSEGNADIGRMLDHRSGNMVRKTNGTCPFRGRREYASVGLQSAGGDRSLHIGMFYTGVFEIREYHGEFDQIVIRYGISIYLYIPSACVRSGICGLADFYEAADANNLGNSGSVLLSGNLPGGAYAEGVYASGIRG